MATQAKAVAEMDLSLIGSDVVDLLLLAGGGYGGGSGCGGAGGFLTTKIKLVSGSHTVTIGGSTSNSYFDGPSGAFIAYKGGIGHQNNSNQASEFLCGSSGGGAFHLSQSQSTAGGGASSTVAGAMRTFFIGAHLGQGNPGYIQGGSGGGAGGEGSLNTGGVGRKWIDGTTYAAGGSIFPNSGAGPANSGNGGGTNGHAGGSGICAIAYVGTTNKFTGGTVSQVGALRIHYFTTSTTFTI